MTGNTAVKSRIRPRETEIARGEAIPGRKERRYSASARVQMNEAVLLLKDVSLSGGCIQSDEFLEIVPNGNYTILIIPEAESRVDTFEVDIVSRWVRMKRNGSETGFIVVVPPGNRVMEHYIKYLKTRTADNEDAASV